MRNDHWGIWIFFLAAALMVRTGTAETLMVNDTGDAGDGTCTTVCTLRDAIANVALGGTIRFDPLALPATITLNSELLVNEHEVHIVGPGSALLAVSAAGSGRVFHFSYTNHPGYPVSIEDLTLRDGLAIGADGADATTPGDDGTKGDPGFGGCILTNGSILTLRRVRIQNCVAKGGDGGNGAVGYTGNPLQSGGTGGGGGIAGDAYGGAIAQLSGGELILIDTSIVNALTIGGKGGDGGNGGSGYFRGKGGHGSSGGGAYGGAIYSSNEAVSVTNSTIARSTAQGGNGGNGGMGDPEATSNSGGFGGGGGSALGGLVNLSYFLEGHFVFATLAEGEAIAGAGGSGGAGATPGSSGSPGSADSTAIYTYYSATAHLHSTAIVGSSPLCSGVTADPGSNNLDQDGTCGANLHGSLVGQFRPLAENAALPFYMPVYSSDVIDTASSCDDSNLLTVGQDMLSTPRPQGAGCDIGAIEADYIFVDDFD